MLQKYDIAQKLMQISSFPLHLRAEIIIKSSKFNQTVNVIHSKIKVISLLASEKQIDNMLTNFSRSTADSVEF